jgi:hypothetical protein
MFNKMNNAASLSLYYVLESMELYSLEAAGNVTGSRSGTIPGR